MAQLALSPGLDRPDQPHGEFAGPHERPEDPVFRQLPVSADAQVREGRKLDRPHLEQQTDVVQALDDRVGIRGVGGGGQRAAPVPVRRSRRPRSNSGRGGPSSAPHGTARHGWQTRSGVKTDPAVTDGSIAAIPETMARTSVSVLRPCSSSRRSRARPSSRLPACGRVSRLSPCTWPDVLAGDRLCPSPGFLVSGSAPAISPVTLTSSVAVGTTMFALSRSEALAVLSFLRSCTLPMNYVFAVSVTRRIASASPSAARSLSA